MSSEDMGEDILITMVLEICITLVRFPTVLYTKVEVGDPDWHHLFFVLSSAMSQFPKSQPSSADQQTSKPCVQDGMLLLHDMRQIT